MFRRWLSDGLLAELESGRLRPVVDACHADGLVIALRTDYLNVYENGRSLAKIEARAGGRIRIAGAYTDGHLAGLAPDAGAGWSLAATQRWVDDLPRLRARASRYAGAEDRREHQLLLADRTLIDRQVADPGERANRADVVGLLEGTFVIAELKAGTVAPIRQVGHQVQRYLDHLAPGGRLRADVAHSYARMSDQLNALGFAAPRGFTSGMPARGIAVLYDYNRRSSFLADARSAARTLPVDIGLLVADDVAPLPPPSAWDLL